jgi:arylsulfatase
MPEELVRDHLPIPDRPYAGPVYEDAKDPQSTFPPIEPLRPPAGAPNVLIILLDDVGFGASSAFGGPCATPTAERLAANGLKYNRFHTTALCSPTRQALLTGRNHHSVRDGRHHGDRDLSARYNSIRPNSAAPLAETLKLNGYSTGAVRQVPRGARMGDEPARALRLVADRRRRLRALLRLHRRRDEPVRARAL